MKKNLILSMTTVLLSSWLFVSCSATSGVEGVGESSENYTHFKAMPLSKVHQLIVEAGEEDGWRMTEFKENSIIAEKTEGDGDTEAVTVNFTENSFYIEPENGDLEDAIEDKLGI
jgi:hypothetical protein